MLVLCTCGVTFVQAVAVLQLMSQHLRASCVAIEGAGRIIVSKCGCTVTPTVTALASVLCVNKSKPKSINYLVGFEFQPGQFTQGFS